MFLLVPYFCASTFGGYVLRSLPVESKRMMGKRESSYQHALSKQL